MSERPAVRRRLRAEAAAEAAREQLGSTLEEIQQLLSPTNLLNEAVDHLRARGHDIAGSTVSKLMSKPVVATAAASAIGLLIKKKPGLAMLAKLILPGAATTSRPKHSKARKRRAPAATPASATDKKETIS